MQAGARLARGAWTMQHCKSGTAVRVGPPRTVFWRVYDYELADRVDKLSCVTPIYQFLRTVD